MSDFEGVYREAFTSGTGQEFTSALVTHDYMDYLDGYVGRYGNLSSLPSPLALPLGPGDWPISAPEFAGTDEGLMKAARVAFFGRKLIDTARNGIAEILPTSMDLDAQFIMKCIYSVLSPSSWYAAHPDTDPSIDLGHHQDAASPLRIAEWPKGEFINCLGISIAAVAAAETFGLRHLYGNEIKQADERVAMFHQDLMRKLKRILPYWHEELLDYGFYNLAADNSSAASRAYNDGSQKPSYYEDSVSLLLDDRLNTASDADLRDWHHFVAIEFPTDDGESQWYQFDPYALTYATLRIGDDNPHDLLIDNPTAPIGTTSMHVEPTEASYRIFRAYSNALDSYRDWIARYPVEQVHWVKTKRDYKKLAAGVNEQMQVMTNIVMSALGTDSVKERNRTEHIYRTILLALYVHDHPEAGHTGPGPTYKCVEPEPTLLNQDTLEHTFTEQSRIKQDTVMKIAQLLPLAHFLHLYAGLIKTVFRFKSYGTANIVSEYAHPDFMIGAMYLNHYATNRKDGKVNVARELARLTSSQLIWHDAMEDPEAEEDVSVASTSKMIARMKTRLLHTKVRVHQPRKR